MNLQMQNDYGTVQIDSGVIAKMAGSFAMECFGIVGMASVNMRDGFVKLVSKNSSMTHGIRVNVSEDNKIEIDFHIIVAYGVNIAVVCGNLIDTVKYQIEEFCSMSVGKINVFVEGVQYID